MILLVYRTIHHFAHDEIAVTSYWRQKPLSGDEETQLNGDAPYAQSDHELFDRLLLEKYGFYKERLKAIHNGQMVRKKSVDTSTRPYDSRKLGSRIIDTTVVVNTPKETRLLLGKGQDVEHPPRDIGGGSSDPKPRTRKNPSNAKVRKPSRRRAK